MMFSVLNDKVLLDEFRWNCLVLVISVAIVSALYGIATSKQHDQTEVSPASVEQSAHEKMHEEISEIASEMQVDFAAMDAADLDLAKSIRNMEMTMSQI